MWPRDMKLSFTAIALGLNEFELLARLRSEEDSWDAVQERVHKETLLKRTTRASVTRVMREVRQRIQCLAPETRSNFLDWGYEERRAIALIAACKCYPFIFDFIRITLKDKLQVFDQALRDEDLDGFWNSKAVDYPELEEIALSTKKKLKQVLIRLLAEAGLLTETKNPWITPKSPPGRIEEVFEREGGEYRDAFLI
jgi:hypothetical protein